MMHDDDDNFNYSEEFPDYQPNIIQKILCMLGIHTWWIRSGRGYQGNIQIDPDGINAEEISSEIKALMKTMPSNCVLTTKFCKICGKVDEINFNGKKIKVDDSTV